MLARCGLGRAASAPAWDRPPWAVPAGGRRVWGPSGWAYLHSMAISYPQEPALCDVHRAGQLIVDFVARVPCLECVQHITNYILKHPLALDSGDSFQIWVWRFHNFVNHRLGHRELSLQEYTEHWREEIEAAKALQ